MNPHEKVRQKSDAGRGHYKPRTASERTENLWKHQCIHCGGWTPCESEGLAWHTPSGDQSFQTQFCELCGGPHAGTPCGPEEGGDGVNAVEGEDDSWRDAITLDDVESP